MVQERSEPLFPILSCCLTYPLERAGRTFPALSPERVALGRVPLGQPPSLRRLRCRSLGFVRRLRTVLWSCPTSHVCSSSACVLRLPDTVCSFSPLQTDVGSPGSRARMVPCMLGVSDRAGSGAPCDGGAPGVAFRLFPRASAPRRACCFRSKVMISRLNTQPARSPVNASTPPLRVAPHDSRPLWFATPSTYETFIHNTLPVFTGAPKPYENHSVVRSQQARSGEVAFISGEVRDRPSV